ncbi:PIG-L deacetylase family protein [Nocardia arizonensis]|uniref:PIG-L deacetylase family protein n=1 Tax=Nocardia arizonensis TaxID=1141647 RepID=UPI000AC796A5|nr:PIG-L deacetylase family protein [Nocardia arizonensis]
MIDVLVVVAHPDDIDFGGAGTIANWSDAGEVISYCLVTAGETGSVDPKISAVQLAEIRMAEQRAAANIVGVDDIRFLGFPDGLVAPTTDLRRALAGTVRELRPRRIVTHSPVRNIRRVKASHPDHVAVGEAVMCAVYPDARNPGAFPELLEQNLAPHIVEEVWLMTGRDADTYVDISANMDRKIAAVLAHRSQHEHPDSVEPSLRRWASTIAAAGPDITGEYAESFLVVDTA